MPASAVFVQFTQLPFLFQYFDVDWTHLHLSPLAIKVADMPLNGAYSHNVCWVCALVDTALVNHLLRLV